MADVLLYVSEHFVEPLFAFGRVAGANTIVGEYVAQPEVVAVQVTEEAAAQAVVEYNGMRRHYARQVESLCGGHHCYGYVLGRVAYRGHHNVLVACEREVGVYFVGHNDDVVLCAQVGQAAQFFFRP